MTAILVILGIFHAANGAAMLFLPDLWYASVPGVAGTGPANAHFIRDIGLAFIAASACLLFGARREAGALILVPGAIFLAGHAGLHVIEMLLHRPPAGEVARDLAAIALPGFLPVLAIASRWLRPGLPLKGEIS